MRPEGWAFLILSWTAILALFAFSLAKTLRPRDKNGPD